MRIVLEFFNDLDTELFLFLNSLHCPYFDCFMSTFSGKVIWLPVYLAALYLLFKNYKWKTAVCYLITIICIIILCDKLCAGSIRHSIARLRPANPDNPISHLVHIVNNYRGGRYGFPSCHAANSFGFAMFMVCVFRKAAISVPILIWAAVNSYSRLYLGVHYPGDLIFGALLGCFAAYVEYGIMVVCFVEPMGFPDLPRNPLVHPHVVNYALLAVTAAIGIYAAISCF